MRRRISGQEGYKEKRDIRRGRRGNSVVNPNPHMKR